MKSRQYRDLQSLPDSIASRVKRDTASRDIASSPSPKIFRRYFVPNKHDVEKIFIRV